MLAASAPGKHAYSVSSESKDELNVEIEPDATQYAKCNIRMGLMMGRPNLAPSTKEEFDANSHKLKLVEAQREAAPAAK